MGKNKKNRNKDKKEKKKRNAVHSVVRLNAMKLWFQRVMIMKPEILQSAKDNMDFYTKLRDEWLDDIQPVVKESIEEWKQAAMKSKGGVEDDSKLAGPGEAIKTKK